MHIYEWKARRVGAAITVTGKDSNGADVKLAGVREIEARDGRVVAIDGNLRPHELVL